MGKAYYVTATGTEIGKTFIAAALLRAARQSGYSVHAIKPLMSGFSRSALGACDAGQLLIGCGRDVTAQTVDAICLHSFTEPLAPNVAARRAGVALDDATLVKFCEQGLAAPHDLTLIEGAGGVLSPATDTLLQADLAARLSLPVILISADYLGTVSHTLSAMEALEKRGLKIAAAIISEPVSGANPRAMAEELARWRPETPFLTAPHDDDGIGGTLLATLGL
ncbi:MAG: dethiobiotin synthase [Pseudomonadota bacterium]